MERKVRIKEQSIERLKKDISVYEEELVAMGKERESLPESEDSHYALQNIRERVEETERALESTRKILKRVLQEYEDMQ